MTLRLTLPLVAALLAGCPSAEPPTLDTSGVDGGTYGVAYTGSLGVVGYDGTAAYAINSGALPQGLSMDAAGQITGTPEWLETTSAQILISGLDGFDPIVGDLQITINADGLDVELGYDHDQLNNMTDQYEFMKNIWMRVDGSGDDQQSTWTMDAGLYLAGDDGAHEDGLGDDVRIGDVDFRALDWTFDNWHANRNEDPLNINYPSIHTPDGEPPSFTGRGVFSAHSDTGQADLTVTHPDYPNTVAVKVQIVPPDWCLNGQSDAPQTGVCQ